MRTIAGKIYLLLVFFFLLVATAAFATSGNQNNKDNKVLPGSAAAANHNADDSTMRLEGEKRFHSNCSRCHANPVKFPPRMMATVIRHMRVRATLTDDDVRLILHYMTQ
jgi:mono/diheme cytochrome c family protein